MHLLTVHLAITDVQVHQAADLVMLGDACVHNEN